MAAAKQRPSVGRRSYTTGGQVSRFQREKYEPIPATPEQAAVKAVRIEKNVEKIRKGPKVRVSRGGRVSEVLLDRR